MATQIQQIRATIPQTKQIIQIDKTQHKTTFQNTTAARQTLRDKWQKKMQRYKDRIQKIKDNNLIGYITKVFL